jgi:hypothetical protein
MCWMPYSRLRIRRLVQFVTTALRIDLLFQPAAIVGVQPESLLERKRCARNAACSRETQDSISATRFTAAVVIRKYSARHVHVVFMKAHYGSRYFC